jgi:hypothetical protein
VQDAAVDEIRLEHVWILLTGELLREASRAASGPKLHLLVQQLGLMLSDKLVGLSKLYDARAEQDALDAISASLKNIGTRTESVVKGSVIEPMDLWQADEVISPFAFFNITAQLSCGLCKLFEPR